MVSGTDYLLLLLSPSVYGSTGKEAAFLLGVDSVPVHFTAGADFVLFLWESLGVPLLLLLLTHTAGTPALIV